MIKSSGPLVHRTQSRKSNSSPRFTDCRVPPRMPETPEIARRRATGGVATQVPHSPEFQAPSHSGAHARTPQPQPTLRTRGSTVQGPPETSPKASTGHSGIPVRGEEQGGEPHLRTQHSAGGYTKRGRQAGDPEARGTVSPQPRPPPVRRGHPTQRYPWLRDSRGIPRCGGTQFQGRPPSERTWGRQRTQPRFSADEAIVPTEDSVQGAVSMRAQPSTEPSPHAPQRHSIDASLPPPQAAVNGATEGNRRSLQPCPEGWPKPRQAYERDAQVGFPGPGPLRDPAKIQQDRNDGAHGAVEL